ncbi:MAG: translation elongation factor 4 [bacterium]
MEKTDPRKIRNFSIIAHVDHGKSTLADRILELTGSVLERDFKPQFLDRLEVERERGVTVKLQAVRILYKADDGETYILNLIDTPGHVDFSYEVSRSLAACEGVLLVIDAAQGIEAQTLANFHLAKDAGLTIIPVLNKIDLPTANPERVREEIELVLDLDGADTLEVSAKDGTGVREVLEAVVHRVPPPEPGPGPARGLVFDSHYDQFRGTVAYVRMFAGDITANEDIILMAAGKKFEVSEVGFFSPDITPAKSLGPGEVGYMMAGIKDLHDLHVGDTITAAKNPAPAPLPGYKPVKPMVYCGFFAAEAEEFQNLRDALEKLALNDSSLFYEPESSSVLGFGFRCGFLGLFHMEIVQERLEREYETDLVATAPTVMYRIFTTETDFIEIKNPSDYPEGRQVKRVEEPFVRATVLAPDTYVGAIMELSREKRGVYKSMDYITEKRVRLVYEMPLSEIIFDYFDRLKSCSRGYASLDYDFIGFVESDMVKLNVLVGGRVADSLSMIVHRDFAYNRGKRVVERLRKLIPRHLFDVTIQAALGTRIIARETIPALRKNVTAKCYGGDITRKRKLIQKQREGKRRMKNIGNVQIPQEAYLSILEPEK